MYLPLYYARTRSPYCFPLSTSLSVHLESLQWGVCKLAGWLRHGGWAVNLSHSPIFLRLCFYDSCALFVGARMLVIFGILSFGKHHVHVDMLLLVFACSFIVFFALSKHTYHLTGRFHDNALPHQA